MGRTLTMASAFSGPEYSLLIYTCWMWVFWFNVVSFVKCWPRHCQKYTNVVQVVTKEGFVLYPGTLNAWFSLEEFRESSRRKKYTEANCHVYMTVLNVLHFVYITFKTCVNLTTRFFEHGELLSTQGARDRSRLLPPVIASVLSSLPHPSITPKGDSILPHDHATWQRHTNQFDAYGPHKRLFCTVGAWDLTGHLIIRYNRGKTYSVLMTTLTRETSTQTASSSWRS